LDGNGITGYACALRDGSFAVSAFVCSCLLLRLRIRLTYYHFRYLLRYTATPADCAAGLPAGSNILFYALLPNARGVSRLAFSALLDSAGTDCSHFLRHSSLQHTAITCKTLRAALDDALRGGRLLCAPLRANAAAAGAAPGYALPTRLLRAARFYAGFSVAWLST